MRSAHVIPGEGPQVRYGVIPSEVEESSAVSPTPFTGTATARFLDSLRSLGMTKGTSLARNDEGDFARSE
jgi:hypothetical protein